EIWGALCTGATLAVAPPGVLSLTQLAGFLADHHVDTLWLTAGLFHEVVNTAPEALAGVRQLLAGGDVLAPSVVTRALGHHPELRRVHGYGPTENPTFPPTSPIPSDWSGTSAPIGRPINNPQVYVLDPDLRPVPPGVTGELYTAGAGLARGYLH